MDDAVDEELAGGLHTAFGQGLIVHMWSGALRGHYCS